MLVLIGPIELHVQLQSSSIYFSQNGSSINKAYNAHPLLAKIKIYIKYFFNVVSI
jgi:hypothetical protein